MNAMLNTCTPTASTGTLASPSPPADFTAIKQRQQATWASGDYSIIGTRLQMVGELLAEAVDLRADERVLDVAAGNGNATLAAARRFAQVVSTDYVPQLLAKGAERAKADGLDVRGLRRPGAPDERHHRSSRAAERRRSGLARRTQ